MPCPSAFLFIDSDFFGSRERRCSGKNLEMNNQLRKLETGREAPSGAASFHCTRSVIRKSINQKSAFYSAKIFSTPDNVGHIGSRKVHAPDLDFLIVL